MDQLLALIPTQYLPYATAAVTICAAIAAMVPASAVPAPIAPLYNVINFVALNFGHAKNAATPANQEKPNA